jgi:hypothetical protein
MQTGRTLRARAIFAATLALWLILTALFVVTYPLNTAGDAMNYAVMTLNLQSNVMHASGYPFVIGHLLRLIEPQPEAAARALWDPTGPADAAQMATLLKLLLVQHSVHAGVVVGCALVLLRSLGPLVAVTVVVFWGMSTFFMSAVSTAFPEWLQGDALIVTACLCAVGFFSDSTRKKMLAYVAAGGVLGLAFVVKYNSILFVLIFLAFLFFETMPWRLRGWTALGCAGAFALVAALHFFSFHYPTTRATRLNYDGGWVLITRLETAFGNDAIEGSSGIATLRYRALVRVIPPDYKFAHAFWSLDDVAPADIRAPYRAEYDRIMTMPAAELVELIDRHPRPADFRLWLSVIPLYHYIGLKEADELGTKVYLEFVRDNPLRFAGAVARTVAGTSLSGKARLLVPLDPAAAGLQPTTALASGYVGYLPAPRKSPVSVPYWSPRLLLWQPGLRLFNAVHALRPRPYLELAAYVVVLAGIVFRRGDREKRFITAIALALACYVVASNAVVSFRFKEAHAAWPLACLLWAVAFKWVVELVSARLAAWPPALRMRFSDARGPGRRRAAPACSRYPG